MPKHTRSYPVIYHSPLTTLTILRIARPHIRTLLAGVTLVTAISPNISDPDKPVTPRVVGISGTIKKAQGRIGAYHRAVVAGLMAAIESGECGRGRGLPLSFKLVD
jgi:ribonuclease P/MRP protein subunit POP5